MLIPMYSSPYLAYGPLVAEGRIELTVPEGLGYEPNVPPLYYISAIDFLCHVLSLWQFAHTISHLDISSSILSQMKHISRHVTRCFISHCAQGGNRTLTPFGNDV